ncbi:hypothetical protein CPB84DRAFT_653509 [Gymnopilus junonius]|uniref:Uncharacterized protein n=1 Tax=Gymnopilus junonius TaxID=109634 RepID=A0A9P5NS91_GYMJU|nr:hypothetical protein CPB84DRAFT_653509 [Gymnopilus junonius]
MHRPMLSLKCLLVSESDSMGCTPQSQQFVVQVHPTASVSCLAQAILNIKLSLLGSLHHPSEIYLWKMRHPIFNGRKLYELRLNKREGKEESWPSPQAEMLPPLKAVGCYFGGSSVETEVLVQRAMAPTLSGRLLDRRIDMRFLYTVLSNILDSELNFDSVEHSSPVELCRSRGALKKNIKLLITQDSISVHRIRTM